MIVNLDVAVLENDIHIISKTGYNIDSMFFQSDPNQLPTVRDEGRATIFKRLLSKDRSFIERNLSKSDYVWEDTSDLEPSAEPFGKRAILPIHCYYELEIENMSNLLALQANYKQLYGWRNFGGVMSMLTCKLCNTMLESVTQLRIEHSHQCRTAVNIWHKSSATSSQLSVSLTDGSCHDS